MMLTLPRRHPWPALRLAGLLIFTWLSSFGTGTSTLQAAGVIVEAVSYTKPFPDGKIFVMLGDPAAEQRVTASKPDIAAKLKALREKFPKSGVYVEATGEPIWQLPDTVFSPYDGTFLSDDLRHLVRIEGDWWRTKDFPGGKRPAGDVEAAQLAAPAISFFDSGKLVKTYTLREVLTLPEKVPHSPDHLLWFASGSLNEPTHKFLLFTQDAHRVVFDYRTGEVLSRDAVGLSNPIVVPLLVTVGVSTAGILLLYFYLVFGRRSRRQTQPA